MKKIIILTLLMITTLTTILCFTKKTYALEETNNNDYIYDGYYDMYIYSYFENDSLSIVESLIIEYDFNFNDNYLLVSLFFDYQQEYYNISYYFNGSLIETFVFEDLDIYDINLIVIDFYIESNVIYIKDFDGNYVDFTYDFYDIDYKFYENFTLISYDDIVSVLQCYNLYCYAYNLIYSYKDDIENTYYYNIREFYENYENLDTLLYDFVNTVFDNSEELKENFDNGYDKGFSEGKTECKQTHEGLIQSGRIEGQTKGENVNASFKDMVLSIVNAPAEMIRNVLNFEIFGVNISSLVFFLITAVLVVAIIKFFI